MSEHKKLGDKEIAALGSSAVIFVGLIYYWLTEVVSTMELLELAYGSLRLFNNPLVF
jgi:hypothetical protein